MVAMPFDLPPNPLPPAPAGQRLWRAILNLVAPPVDVPLLPALANGLHRILLPLLLAMPVAFTVLAWAGWTIASPLGWLCALIAAIAYVDCLVQCARSGAAAGEPALQAIAGRYALGSLAGYAALTGLLAAAVLAGLAVVNQALIALFLLAVIGASAHVGPVHPRLAAMRAAVATVPMAAALAVGWGWPAGAIAAAGVLSYGIVITIIARRGFAVAAALHDTRRDLMLERAHMATAMDHIDQAVVLIDSERRVVMANRLALELLGAPAVDRHAPLAIGAFAAACSRLARFRREHADFAQRAGLLMAARQMFSSMLHLVDGRPIDIDMQPVPDGGWLALLRDRNADRAAIARLNTELRRCPLSGLPNRRAFTEELERRMTRARDRAADGQHGCALLLINLDGFSGVNERHGRPFGDRVIARIGFRLRTSAPDLFVAKLEGDEFALLCDRADDAGALALARQLIDVIEQPGQFGAVEVQVGAAIGVAVATAALADGRSGADLLRAGDDLLRAGGLALMAARRQPGSAVQLFRPALLAESLAVSRLERRVGQALRAGAVDVAFQPVLDLASGSAVAVEALVRWPQGRGDRVSADELVRIAEARGLVAPLRRLVLEQAARVVAALPAPATLWLNTSVHDLDQPGFADEVLAELDMAGLPVDRFGLEVTETALMREPDDVIATLHRFRALGACVALDDFGAGFCSLDRIRLLPIDVLKISPQLLLGAGNDDHASAIFTVAAGLGQSLGLVVVAEGVETAGELALARRAGVTRVQGYALSPPVSAAELAVGLATAERNLARAMPVAMAVR